MAGLRRSASTCTGCRPARRTVLGVRRCRRPAYAHVGRRIVAGSPARSWTHSRAGPLAQRGRVRIPTGYTFGRPARWDRDAQAATAERCRLAARLGDAGSTGVAAGLASSEHAVHVKQSSLAAPRRIAPADVVFERLDIGSVGTRPRPARWRRSLRRLLRHVCRARPCPVPGHCLPCRRLRPSSRCAAEHDSRIRRRELTSGAITAGSSRAEMRSLLEKIRFAECAVRDGSAARPGTRHHATSSTPSRRAGAKT